MWEFWKEGTWKGRMSVHGHHRVRGVDDATALIKLESNGKIPFRATLDACHYIIMSFSDLIICS